MHGTLPHAMPPRRLLGHGGFASVYEVERASDGVRLAVKVGRWLITDGRKGCADRTKPLAWDFSSRTDGWAWLPAFPQTQTPSR